ncbi:MAG: MFS transporter, partial [Candidatus Dormibacteraeota bacterium]|nr:MFS transporter [Candidatus Dormibacteraeota bacterium]
MTAGVPKQAPSPGTEPVGGRRRYVIFGVTTLGILMASIDGTIVATALHTITRDLQTTVGWSAWTLTTYSLGSIVAMPIAGRLSDSLGRRRMFLVFVAVFTVTSLLAGLSTNIYLLIALRFLQAMGGGGLMPSTMGTVSDLFPRERDRAIGLISSVFPLGALIGPTLGGFIVSNWSWRYVFFVNVPIGVLLLVLLFLLLPRDRTSVTPRIDVLGALLMGAALVSLMLGISTLGEGAGPAAWLIVALGVCLAGVFLFQQRRASRAILPPALLQRREFLVINGINVFYGAAAFGIFSLVPLFAQIRYDQSPLVAGSLLSVRAVGMAVLSVTTSLVLRRTGYRKPMIAGFVFLALGLAMLSLPAPGTPFFWLGLSALTCGVGIGIAGPPSNNAAIRLMPDQVAAISGLRAMFRMTGGIMAITITAAVIGTGGTEGEALGRAFGVFAAIAILVSPAILAVPERTSSAGSGP